jgi:nitrite reductase/ring-hydroxylating ferredoxin subunit
MSLLKRILGICETPPPRDPGCWRFESGVLKVDLSKAQDVAQKGRAVRFEGKGLPQRVLLAHTRQGEWRAYINRCTHMGRRLDFVPESGNIRCCSVSNSLFRSSGELIDGPAKGPIKALNVTVSDQMLHVTVPEK